MLLYTFKDDYPTIHLFTFSPFHLFTFSLLLKNIYHIYHSITIPLFIDLRRVTDE